MSQEWDRGELFCFLCGWEWGRVEGNRIGKELVLWSLRSSLFTFRFCFATEREKKYRIYLFDFVSFLRLLSFFFSYLFSLTRSDRPTGRLALVFELLDKNIYELIKGRKHPLPEEKLKKFMFQLLRAIDHMHRNGIFHRFLHRFPVLPSSSSFFLSFFSI